MRRTVSGLVIKALFGCNRELSICAPCRGRHPKWNGLLFILRGKNLRKCGLSREREQVLAKNFVLRMSLTCERVVPYAEISAHLRQRSFLAASQRPASRRQSWHFDFECFRRPAFSHWRRSRTFPGTNHARRFSTRRADLPHHTCGEIHAAHTKTKAAPKTQEPLRYCRCEWFYWVGNSSCENPIVFTERNDGVLGGSHCGPSVKLLSKVYLREGGP
jgi:hypothetical protein